MKHHQFVVIGERKVGDIQLVVRIVKLTGAVGRDRGRAHFVGGAIG